MALLDLATLKTFLNINGSTSDAELALYVGSVTDVVEAVLGGPVEQRSVTETVEPSDGGRALPLGKRFATAVTSITANGATVSTVDAYVSPGNVVRRKLGYPFSPCLRPVVVTYAAGVAVTAPSALTLAAAVIAAHLWDTQRGQLGAAGPGDDYGTPNTVAPGMGFAVPNRALELMAPWAPDTALVVA